MIVRDWEGMWEAVEYLRHDGDQHDWVALDSLSGWQDVGLDDIWAGVIERNPTRRTYRVDKGEYGVNMWRIEEAIREIVSNSAFNFMLTAWPFTMERELVLSDDHGGDILMPWVQGKSMPQKICGMCNIVGFMEVRKYKEKDEFVERRVMHVNQTGRFYAKNNYRGAWPDGDVWDPTIPKIQKAVKGITPTPVAGRRGRTRKAA